MDTTAFVRNQGQEYEKCRNCHGGEGPFLLKNVIGSVAEKQFITFIHDDVIPPGSTFGYHQHASDQPLEEWYFCLAGHGVMTLDGVEHEMGPGDIGVCRANGFHGLRNTGTEDMRLIVIMASPVGA